MKSFTILAIGDIVGEIGLERVKASLSRLRREKNIDMVIANGENCSSDGRGITPQNAEALFLSGADVITGGNHSFQKRDIYSYLDDHSAILRPANFPGNAPGHGYTIENIDGRRVLVINVMGTLFTESLASPFETADAVLKREKGNFDISVCDIHAEATAEKAAFANYFDGRIDFIFGTHTHVQTSDIRLLPQGTAFITDLGMTGPVDSVIGVKCEVSIGRFLSKLPSKNEIAGGETVLEGAIVEIDSANKKILRVESLRSGGSL